MSNVSLKTRAGTLAAGAVLVAGAAIGPGIVAHSVSPVPADTTAGELLREGLLPDRTVDRFTRAALDGSGQSSRFLETLRGAKEDLFEAGLMLGKVAVVLTRL